MNFIFDISKNNRGFVKKNLSTKVPFSMDPWIQP